MNMAVAVEHHGDWIAKCIGYLRERGHRTIEPAEEAQDDWMQEVQTYAAGSVQSDPSCNSWYLGSNVPGKARVHMVYLGGFPRYDETCQLVAARDYEGFITGK
jgi:cyclohexanone monooxygenase